MVGVAKPFYYLGTGVLIVSLILLLWISPEFSYEIYWADRPNNLLVIIMMLAGLGYLVAMLGVLKNGLLKLGPILLIGLLLRLMLLWSTPVYEDDYFRYFWDGEVTALGLNPYVYAPVDALPPESHTQLDASTLTDLRFHSGPAPDLSVEPGVNSRLPVMQPLSELPYLTKINYPSVKTIYPPLSQLVFAISHWIDPAGLLIWRLILLAVDCLSVWLLLRLLRVFGKPDKWVAIYWLNPILITETINAAHMDVLLLPFLLASVLFARSMNYRLAGLALAGAVGIKLWPIILAPILFRPLFGDMHRLIKDSLPFVLLSCLMVAPQLISSFDNQAGLSVYAQSWQTNSFLFPIIEYCFVWALGTNDASDPFVISRLCIVALVGLCLLVAVKKPFDDLGQMVHAMLYLTAALFLLSPTGYPWYLLWFLPWLAIQPSVGLLLLTLMLPLYDLRYILMLNGESDFFNQIIVTIEFLPTLVLLLLAVLQRFRYAKYKQ